MKRFVLFLLGSIITTALAAAAIAQTSDPASADKGATGTPSASAQTPATASTTPAPDASVAPAAQATKAPPSTPAMDRVKERGMKVSAKDRADVEKKLDDLEKQIEDEVTKGEPAVAQRMAADLGVTADALTAEKSQYGRGWGELTVAHTLMANAKTDATISDLFGLRTQGTGWGAIAAGLDLKLGDVVSAVRSEQRVAAGLEKGDGKPAVIQTAAADAGTTKAEKASTKTSKSHEKGTEAATGAGAGVDLGKAAGK
jgi:hypothetical protein